MKLITKIMEEKALPIVDKIYNDGFIQGLIRADLSEKAVEHYLKADALYLENFSDIYAILLAKSNDKNEKNCIDPTFFGSHSLPRKESPHYSSGGNATSGSRKNSANADLF